MAGSWVKFSKNHIKVKKDTAVIIVSSNVPKSQIQWKPICLRTCLRTGVACCTWTCGVSGWVPTVRVSFQSAHTAVMESIQAPTQQHMVSANIAGTSDAVSSPLLRRWTRDLESGESLFYWYGIRAQARSLQRLTHLKQLILFYRP